MEKIVIATDGSPTGRAALTAGVELAADERARVVVVHVVSILDFAEHDNGKTPAGPQRLPRAEEDGVLQDALATAAEHGVDATSELLVGYPPKQIVRLASELGADLIVVGSRGLSRLQGAVMASTSREVLRQAGCPVLVVQPVRAAVPAGD
jgi:nucleotide-binding universal stress UspA family protein